METNEIFDEERYGDWHEAFSAAAPLAKRGDIERVIWASTESPEGYGSCEVRGVFAMKDACLSG